MGTPGLPASASSCAVGRGWSKGWTG